MQKSSGELLNIIVAKLHKQGLNKAEKNNQDDLINPIYSAG